MRAAYRYVEIVDKDGEVVKRSDVTGWSDRLVERLDDGLNRNMNHESYFTRIIRSTKKLPVLP